jgi:mannose-6-phosphate isomerase
MWVVLHAEPGAALVLGLEPGATREAFREALEAGDLEKWLHVLPVQAGDAICVPTGTIHAILGGSVMVEIQQNSDATYRVYDWGRTGPDGKPRPLHVEKALEVIDFARVRPGLARPELLEERDGLRRWALCRGPTFVVERVEMAAGSSWQGLCNGESLEIWGATAGAVTVDGGDTSLPLPAVRFALLPASMGPFTLTAQEPAGLLRARLLSPQATG